MRQEYQLDECHRFLLGKLDKERLFFNQSDRDEYDIRPPKIVTLDFILNNMKFISMI
jgi:hypothetical protein